ncbi:conjugal transfer protein TraB [Shinella sp. CPCC 100929]|uniref:Conjugal transfer protein TraB n=1 Tax=Shinella lacus TaxID=2654216 RepID=A0ABT1RBZ4_9HYPH|nr:conjugal transfer protein TraB [Shinella lacus]MCQ4632724.1 conjugal transfer protein TraB [Shinella lacus]
MRLKPILIVALAGLSLGTGWVGWSGNPLLLPVALAFPVLWSLAPGRAGAGVVAASYFLAASRGLPQGVATFYQSDLTPGLALWLIASSSFVVVHAVLWTSNVRYRPVAYLVASALMALPPFGITGWAHPITAAGILFPGWGWWGVSAMTAGLIGLVTRVWPAAILVLSSLWLWSAATWTGPNLADGWRGVDLHLGASLGRDTGLQRHRALIATAHEHIQQDGGVIVLPESALGNWTPTVERLWASALSGTTATVIAGASEMTLDGYDNVLVALTTQGGRILYRERMPVPGSMWQPWRAWFGQSGGARADFFADPVIELNGKIIAPLICYEQLLVWPVLQSMLHDPDLIVAVGNGWWTDGTSIVDIQRASVTAWARLFAKPLFLSFNT